MTIAAGEVSSIGATVVPVEGVRWWANAGSAAHGRSRIARRAVAGPRRRCGRCRPPMPARRHRPRRAGAAPRGASGWSRSSRPARQATTSPRALCIVVDAETGKVIGRWPGMADRPDRGPDARGARPRRHAPLRRGASASTKRSSGPGTGATGGDHRRAAALRRVHGHRRPAREQMARVGRGPARRRHPHRAAGRSQRERPRTSRERSARSAATAARSAVFDRSSYSLSGTCSAICLQATPAASTA